MVDGHSWGVTVFIFVAIFVVLLLAKTLHISRGQGV